MHDQASPARALVIIAGSTLLAMSVWFSASFVLPQLTTQWDLTQTEGSLLTIAVQLGFVVGAVLSAVSGMADAVPARRLFALGAFGAATANLALLVASGPVDAVALRFLTGFCLAAVYPSALKETSTWFRAGRGTALGIMVGALTIGSALPHAVNAVVGVDWRAVIVTTTTLTAVGGLLILTLRRPGPHPFPRRPVTVGAAVRSLRNRNVVLADLGYMGHSWELYAMWATIGGLVTTVPLIADAPRSAALGSAVAFVCIAVGAVGCWVGGLLGDRRGHARAARTSMVCSGGAALALAVGLDVLPSVVVIALCVFWGFWVIADSAQFSTIVSKHAGPEIVGGALSLQLALGYVTTTITIWLVPVLVDHSSWRVALVALALGPAVGSIAMTRLIAVDRAADGGRT